MKNRLPYLNEADWALWDMLPQESMLDGLDTDTLAVSDAEKTYEVTCPSEGYGFLHEAAVIEFKGILFAAWYNCPTLELTDRSPIRFTRSMDGGKTWEEPQIVADDPTGAILYCPPVFGIDDGKLYMLLNQMVSADHMHSLDLYVYEEETVSFKCLWSRPIPFKLNTNVYKMDNGKLLLPGRIGELDQFPNTPAVLISDSGKIDAEWRLVYIQPDGSLPDGAKLVFPELSAVIDGANILIFCRDDERNVPLLYRSADYGESWVGPIAHDIPFSGSKIYSGTLEDGRNYVIGNMQPDRRKLVLLFSRPGEMKMSSGIVLHDGPDAQLGYGEAWHYPCACEADGKLYVIYTVNIKSPSLRGAVVSVIDLDKV